MRDPRRWGIQAVLLLGLGASLAVGADREERTRTPKPPTDSDGGWGWVNPKNWFGSKEKAKPAPKKDKKDTKKDVARRDPPLPSPAEEARQRQARAEADFWRRVEVCDKLREVAVRKDDADMLRRVEELSERVYAVYLQRSGGRVPAGDVEIDPDLRRLDTMKDTEAALRRRPSEEPIYSVTSDRKERRSAIKEVDR